MKLYIIGRITWQSNNGIILETNTKFGYYVVCPKEYFVFNLKEIRKVFIYEHHQEKKETIMFGFENEDDRYLFKNLLKINNIGPVKASTLVYAKKKIKSESDLLKFKFINAKNLERISRQFKKISKLISNDSNYPKFEKALKDLDFSNLEIEKSYKDIDKSLDINLQIEKALEARNESK